MYVEISLLGTGGNWQKGSSNWLEFHMALGTITYFHQIAQYKYWNLLNSTMHAGCRLDNMWPNTSKGTSCLHLRKLRFLHYLTEYLTSFPHDTKFVKSDSFENISFTNC